MRLRRGMSVRSYGVIARHWLTVGGLGVALCVVTVFIAPVGSAQAANAAPVMTTSSTPAGVAGVMYESTIAASGSPAPTFAVTAGALPTNLTLTEAGVLSGLPKTAATYTFTVTATNVAGSVAKAYSVAVTSPVNLLLNPSQETVSTKVLARTNLLNNPRLTSYIGVEGYYSSPLSIETGTPNAITTTTNSTSLRQGIIVKTTSSLPADTYTVSAFIRASVGTTVAFSMRLGTPNYSESNGVVVRAGTGAWERVSSVIRTTDTRSFIGMQVINSVARSGDVIKISQPLVEQAFGAQPFFDGIRAYPAISGTTYAWAGTADDSISYQYVDTVANTPGFGGTKTIAARSTDWAASGSYSARIISTGGTASPEDTFVGWDGQAGKTYTILGTSRTVGPLLNADTPRNGVNQIVAYALDGATNVIAKSARPANVAGVYKQRLTITTPADATYISFRWYNGVSNGNGDVWWDDLAVIEGDYRGDGFSGATAGAAWAGTAHASTSSMATPPVPNLRVSQTVGSVESSSPASAAYVLADKSLTWNYLVTNIGTIPVTGIAVTNDHGVAVSCPGATLNAGVAMTCSNVGTIGAGLYGIAQ